MAKTEEELEDRHQSLLGDADNSDDIKIDMANSNNSNANGHTNGEHVASHPGSNGQIPTQMHNGRHDANLANVSPTFDPDCYS